MASRSFCSACWISLLQRTCSRRRISVVEGREQLAGRDHIAGAHRRRRDEGSIRRHGSALHDTFDG
jgi:hypothetical protein